MWVNSTTGIGWTCDRDRTGLVGGASTISTTLRVWGYTEDSTQHERRVQPVSHPPYLTPPDGAEPKPTTCMTTPCQHPHLLRLRTRVLGHWFALPAGTAEKSEFRLRRCLMSLLGPLLSVHVAFGTPPLFPSDHRLNSSASCMPPSQDGSPRTRGATSPPTAVLPWV